MNNTLDVDFHLKTFAEEFVLDSRRDKWITLLSERPENILSQSNKLFNYLDHNFIEQDDSLVDVAADDMLGVYYDFDGELECITLKDAVNKDKEGDSIFSISPGKLVIFFYHEGWNFVCKKM